MLSRSFESNICAGLGVMFCGEPAFEVDAGLSVKLDNVMSKSGGSEIQITVGRQASLLYQPPPCSNHASYIADVPGST